MNEMILDVRERDEFEAEHIENSINVPLSHFASVAPGVLNQLRERNVIVMCRSGARARLALEQIALLGYSDKVNAKTYEGGIIEWKRRGKPVVQRKKAHLPILRQVQLASGTMIVISTLLGVLANPWFFAVAGFTGAGLMVAGLSGYCGMANLLALMPWNKTSPEITKELCQVSPSSSGCKEA